MTANKTDRPLFSGFVPGTALARLVSVVVLAVVLLLYGQQQGFDPVASLGAILMLGGFILGALYNPLRVGLGAGDATVSADDPRLRRGASWAGGATGLVLATMAAALLQWELSGRDAALDVLTTAALGLNLAYLPAKSACLLHGCCRATRGAAGWIHRLPGDLRGFELAGTGITLVTMLLLPSGSSVAVLAGLTGHLIVRAIGIDQRGFRLDLARLSDDPGFELPGLAGLAALTLLLA